MLITVFTPTYNRAHTLGRTFESLCRQKMPDFEWLIIDDGSKDGTKELVESFKEKSTFPINYIRKENGGKHTAHNEALKHAKGILFFTVDSDDLLTHDSLSQIKKFSKELLENQKACGIIALKEYTEGNIIGKEFPWDSAIMSLKEIEKKGYGGERSLIFKTEVLKKYPFPIIDGERFMTESVIYDRIALDYKFLVKNISLTVCEYQPDGLTNNIIRTMVENPTGFYIYFGQRIDFPECWSEILKNICSYHAFKRLTAKDKRKNYSYSGKHSFLVNLLWPCRYIMTFYYKSRIQE